MIFTNYLKKIFCCFCLLLLTFSCSFNKSLIKKTSQNDNDIKIKISNSVELVLNQFDINQKYDSIEQLIKFNYDEMCENYDGKLSVNMFIENLEKREPPHGFLIQDMTDYYLIAWYHSKCIKKTNTNKDQIIKEIKQLRNIYFFNEAEVLFYLTKKPYLEFLKHDYIELFLLEALKILHQTFYSNCPNNKPCDPPMHVWDPTTGRLLYATLYELGSYYQYFQKDFKKSKKCYSDAFYLSNQYNSANIYDVEVLEKLIEIELLLGNIKIAQNLSRVILDIKDDIYKNDSAFYLDHEQLHKCVPYEGLLKLDFYFEDKKE